MTRPGLDRRAPKSRWTRFLLALAVLIVVVAAYGTLQETRRPPSPESDPDSGRRLLAELYRNAALPRGWEFERVEPQGAGRFAVTVRFNPPLNDPRYGRPADPGSADPATLCPPGSPSLAAAGILALRVRARDKTGIVAELDCHVAAP